MSPTRSDVSPQLLSAANRAGAVAVVDLERGRAAAARALAQVDPLFSELIAVRVPADCEFGPTDIVEMCGRPAELMILAAGHDDRNWHVSELVVHSTVLVEVTAPEQAHVAQASGAHGLVIRGSESGGSAGGAQAGGLSAFVLLQQLLAIPGLDLPIWVAGGIGPRTAAAVVMAGAAGVLLDSQLALMAESDVPDDIRHAIRRLDGPPAVGSVLAARNLGADAALARLVAARWPDTAAAVRGFRTAVETVASDSPTATVLTAGSSFAADLGIELPVLQGPMTRVSDEPAFAAAVARGGALPFVALSLLDSKRSAELLRDTAAQLGVRPWGVGILGFAPDEVRLPQLAAIRAARPNCVIIAGGRPAQSAALEADGIPAFLHVPSPDLLAQFLAAGARRFIFEGSECGGHVGPRTSFCLWEAQVDVLERFLDEAGPEVPKLQVAFAGGIHDARSAAMVAVISGGLAARGVQVGILMGTAYLFTHEAVEHGAIGESFQQLAAAATATDLLETAPGHLTRCLPSPYVQEFQARRDALHADGVPKQELWEQLERLNLGRLRIATKGLRRDVVVDDTTRRAEGLFMAGQVVALRDSVLRIADLHDDVTAGAATYLRSRARLVKARAVRADEGGPQTPLDIAIIGMACEFPGDAGLDGYWRTVISGRDAVTEVPADRWDRDVYLAAQDEAAASGRKVHSKWGAFIRPVAVDATKFGIPPASLGSIDPSQLLALETARRALVDAGEGARGSYAGQHGYPGGAGGYDHERTGVIFGTESGGDFFNATTLRMVLPGYLGGIPDELEELLPSITEDTFPGALPNVVAGRIANRLDLGGPNFTVDAACAASLAALDAACKQLTGGSADLMLCGGVDVHNSIADYLLFGSVQALSPSGRIRPFDVEADGAVLGEGVACVVLKRLVDAERDGDRIYAVIRGIGAASDGRAKGLTAPRPIGQQRAMARAYGQAGLDPAQVELVEAHGTGTAVGDEVELESLTAIFEAAGARAGGCVLGSVKSQIGHTKCAAGLAGVIKAALAIYTGVQPPTNGLASPLPSWDSERSPFAFLSLARPWSTSPVRRVAGVSAFGFGGTNFHAVLSGVEGATEPRHAMDTWPAELFLFRGADTARAHAHIRRLLDSEALRRGGPSALATLAATESSTAGPGDVRVAVVARDLHELSILLDRALASEHDPISGLIQPGSATELLVDTRDRGKVAFLFPGQGSQRVGALRELFVAFPELRAALGSDQTWVEHLFPADSYSIPDSKRHSDRLRDTRIAQPALGIGGVAADILLRRLGIEPDMTAGHSYGELAALYSAGAFDRRVLLDLSCARAKAITDSVEDLEVNGESSDAGAMAAVLADGDRVLDGLRRADLDRTVVIANYNGPEQVVISGPTPELNAAVRTLRSDGLSVHPLAVACAFHSPVVAGASDKFAAALAETKIFQPDTEVWSNLTAEPYAPGGDDIRRVLVDQLSNPVRFVDEITNMYESGARIFVEAGPGRILTDLVDDILGPKPHLALSVEPAPAAGIRGLLIAVGSLACAGVPVRTDWLFRGRGRGDSGTPNIATTSTATGQRSARPGWSVDGQLVRDQAGVPVAGGMQPARIVKELAMLSSADRPGVVRVTESEAELARSGGLVLEYLRTTRELAEAQKQVMLSYLGDRVDPARVGSVGTLPSRVSVDDVPESPVNSDSAFPVPAIPEVPEVAEVPEVPISSEVHGGAGEGDLEQRILRVISDRTGYPIELIELDLDLEADLGIDSIKRAEVAGEVAAQLSLPTVDAEAHFEDLVQARTVRSMLDLLRLIADPLPATVLPPASPLADRTEIPSSDQDEAGVLPGRYLAEWVDATADSAGSGFPPGTRLLVSGPSRYAEALAVTLRDADVVIDVVNTLDEVAGVYGVADGVVILDALSDDPGDLVIGVFAAVKDALRLSARWIVSVAAAGSQISAGLSGLMRTVARENPDVGVRHVEVTGDIVTDDVARIVSRELRVDSRSPVVSYRAGVRFRSELRLSPLDRALDADSTDATQFTRLVEAAGLDRDSIVLLVGGARGITAELTKALADAVGCQLELVGRTALSTLADWPDLVGISDLSTIRAALVARGGATVGELTREASRLAAANQVQATLDYAAAAGSPARYHQVDVGSPYETGELIKDIYAEFGRIDAVVNAAGVIEDRLIADKDVASFSRVWDAKVGGATNVLGALSANAVKPSFVVQYGSISGLYGTRGQADYAGANCALEQLGASWSDAHGVRCLTAHWGPWATLSDGSGMVSPELQQQYDRLGVEVINPRAGVTTLLRELAYGNPALTTVTFTPGLW